MLRKSALLACLLFVCLGARAQTSYLSWCNTSISCTLPFVATTASTPIDTSIAPQDDTISVRASGLIISTSYTLQIQTSAENTSWSNCGSSVTVSAGASVVATCSPAGAAYVQVVLSGGAGTVVGSLVGKSSLTALNAGAIGGYSVNFTSPASGQSLCFNTITGGLDIINGSCGGGSTNPAGSNGAIQYALNSTTFGGASGTAGDAVGFGSSAPVDLGPGAFNVKAAAYGAKGNTRFCYDAVTTASSPTLTSATCAFTSADTGKSITVAAGAQGIINATYTSGGSITGSTNQTCHVTTFNDGLTGVTGTIYLTSSNTIAASTPFYFTVYGTGATAAPTTAVLTSGTATCSGAIVISSTLVTYPLTTTVTEVNSTTLTLASNATTAGTGLSMSLGTDDTTAIQNAITAAEAVNGTVYIPTGAYTLTATLTSSAPFKMYGDGAFPDYGLIVANGTGAYGDIIPLQTPFLTGSVLVQSKGATDALDATTVGSSIRLSDFGVIFAPPIAFWDTGNGITVSGSTVTNYGEFDGTWDGVRVWGGDAQGHYAYIVNCSNYWTAIGLSSWGGGGLEVTSSGCESQTGNMTVVNPYFDSVGGGTSYGIYLPGGNLYSFIRPQSNFYPITQNASATTLATWPIPLVNKYVQENMYAASATSLSMFATNWENSFGFNPNFTYPTAGGTADIEAGGVGTLLPQLSVGPTYGGGSGAVQLLYSATQCNSTTTGGNLGIFGHNNVGVMCNDSNQGIRLEKAQLASTYTNATGTPSSIWSFPVAASTTYHFRCEGQYKAASGGAFELTVTGPASPTNVSYNFRPTVALSAAAPTDLVYSATGTSYPSALNAAAVTTAATDMPFNFDFDLNNGTTAGTITIEGNTISTDTLTVEIGATCVIN